MTCPRCYGFRLSNFLPPCSLCGGAGKVTESAALAYCRQTLPQPHVPTLAEAAHMRQVEALMIRGGYWSGGPRGLPRWIPPRSPEEQESVRLRIERSRAKSKTC